MAGEELEKGQAAAHTRGISALEGAGTGSDEERQGILDAAAQLFDQGLHIVPDDDVLELVAEFSNAQRRGPGRPKGAANRRNASMLSYLKAKGHRDPMEFLSLVFSASTNKMAELLHIDPKDVLNAQIKAAGELLPYGYAKKPQEVVVQPGAARPLMVMGDLNVTQVNATLGETGMMPIIVDNQTLSDDDAMRDENDVSHD